MRVAIVGSRKYPKLWKVSQLVESKLAAGDVVISGGAQGVDRWAVEAARACGLETVVHTADWAKHGAAAGYKRNIKIVDDADRVVAFWDGESRGTRHSIDLADDAAKPLAIIYPDRIELRRWPKVNT